VWGILRTIRGTGRAIRAVSTHAARYTQGVSHQLARVPLRTPCTVVAVNGARAVRRRLLELGLIPGTQVTVVGVSPLGDPLELEVRGSRLSIRKKEAFDIEVER
jgi:ferrous iron transport protein A